MIEEMMNELSNEDLMRLVFVGGKEYEAVKMEIMARLQDGRALLAASTASDKQEDRTDDQRADRFAMTDEQKRCVEWAARKADEFGYLGMTETLRELLAASAPNASAEPVAVVRQIEGRGARLEWLLTDVRGIADGTQLYAAPAPSDKQEPQREQLASMTRMFHAACADLGLINEALGLDPDEGGAAPIIAAINELKRARDEWVDAQYAAASIESTASVKRSYGSGMIDAIEDFAPVPDSTASDKQEAAAHSDMQTDLWSLVEEARAWEKSYLDSGILYESLDSYKHAVELSIRHIVNRYALANPCDKQEAVYQVAVQGLSGLWRDVHQKAYDQTHPNQRRIVYAAPPAQSAEQDADIETIQQLSYKQGFNYGREVGRTEAAPLANQSGKQEAVTDHYAEGVKDASEAMTALQKYRTVYQVIDEESSAWHDVDWLTYEGTAENDRRVMFTAVPPAQSAEQDRIDAEPFPYQQTFDAIAFATKIEGGGIAISVEKFRKAFDAIDKGASK